MVMTQGHVLSHEGGQRVRVRLARRGMGCALSQLQQIDMVKKALVNAGWPVSYGQSRKAKIRISFGPAISVGYESECELFDLDLAKPLDKREGSESLQKHLSEGYSVRMIKNIPRFFPSLEASSHVASYEVSSLVLKNTANKWEEFWKKSQFLVVKKKKDRDVVVDVRACVKKWILEDEKVQLDLRFGPGRTLKPERVIQAICDLPNDVTLGYPIGHFCVNRKALFLERKDGGLIEI